MRFLRLLKAAKALVEDDSASLEEKLKSVLAVGRCVKTSAEDLDWLENELGGYADGTVPPKYRVKSCIAYGDCQSYGAPMQTNQPIPTNVLRLHYPTMLSPQEIRLKISRIEQSGANGCDVGTLPDLDKLDTWNVQVGYEVRNVVVRCPAQEVEDICKAVDKRCKEVLDRIVKAHRIRSFAEKVFGAGSSFVCRHWILTLIVCAILTCIPFHIRIPAELIPLGWKEYFPPIVWNLIFVERENAKEGAPVNEHGVVL